MLLAKKDFRENLKYVKDKKGEVIDSITEKCSLNTQYAQAYTEALFDEIREATLDRKLCLLFLIDSILKHCKKSYQEFIQKGIIDVFCNAYEASKDRPEIRKELRFLFKVWELYFSHTTLMSIDASLKLKLGEDINTSLSAEELDHIIAHYRKIKEDPNHLELQKALLMRTAPPKVPKKEKKEKEESSLYVPDDIKNRLEANAAPEKKVKTIRPKPPATDAPKQNVNGSTGVAVKKIVAGELPPKRPDGEPKLRKAEGDVLLKKAEGKPPIPRKPENEIVNKKMEVEAPLKKVDAPTAVRKLSKGDPGYTIKKKTAPTRREKASIVSDEQALGAKRKIIKMDQDEVKNISEAPPVERRKLPTGIPKPPEDSRVISRRENMMHTDRDIPDKPLNSNLDQEPMKRFPPSQHQPPRQLEQSRSFEESFEAGAFSDDESNQIPTKQPPADSGYIKNSINPNFHQQSHMQQPPHVQPPHMRQPGQHPHYQYQQNPQFPPQPHFQGPPQNPQSQYPRPHFRNTNPEPGQGYPPVNQFQQPSQLQPFQQGHHSQTHPPGPSHFQSQPQFPNQPEDHGLGPAPNQYQNRPFNPQRQQQHSYNQFPIPFQSQEPPQGQFRPNMTPEQQMNTMNPQFAEQAPRNEDKLLEIRNMLMTSRRPGPEPIRPPQDFNPDLQLLSTTRKDSFPDPRNFKQTPEIQFYDQGNALVFRSLLQGIKRELPGSVKAKYEHRLGRMVSLSEMVVRRDFNIVESLYERLPYRCSSCGMRFANRTPLDKHLDNHLRFNMEQKEKTKTMNLREQLITTEHWIKDEGHKNYKTANIENGEDDFEFENYVPTSEDQRSCKACGETFKEVWDKDKETWLLDTATKVKYKEEEASDEAKQKNGVSYDLMHFRCYKLCLQIESK